MTDADIMAEIAADQDERIRSELALQPLDERGIRDLDYLARLCQRQITTPLMIETAAAIAKERADRLAARLAGPVFARKAVVEVIALDKLHNGACSAPLPIGIRGRVVGMVAADGEAQVGLVEVRFPPKPLGYSGREHLTYYVPNTCLCEVTA